MKKEELKKKDIAYQTFECIELKPCEYHAVVLKSEFHIQELEDSYLISRNKELLTYKS